MTWTMPADAASVPLARHRVVTVLHASGIAEQCIADAALLTTELATNAVEHARTPFTLTMELSDRTLRVGVRDDSPLMPFIRPVRCREIGGLGLRLVATLADRWGCERGHDGKRVWFESDYL
jgi:anti-sigma regulatory factor (Ser/Thr protein kinase)